MLIVKNGWFVKITANGHQKYIADRYDWYKRLPGQPEKMLSFKGRILKFPDVHFHDEGYYCYLAYYQDQLQHKGCFKLIVLGKCVIPNTINIIQHTPCITMLYILYSSMCTCHITYYIMNYASVQ